jgi:Glycogen recognition site of AMP-activated protein kinase
MDDPLIDEVVRALRQPVELDSSLDRRVLHLLRRSRARGLRRLGLAIGLTLAAGLVALRLGSQIQTARPVRFELHASRAVSVAVVGDFNQWDPAATPLIRSETGEWSVTISLPPGRYRFSFLVDGRTWVADPTRQRIPDPDFDVPTSLLAVEEKSL